MKSIPLAALTLIAPILLTSCASSPNVENQNKLIEYQNCLETYRDLLVENMKRFPPSNNDQKEQRIEASQTYSMKQCAKYRP